jgi:putative tryptophan/tyrosine transport system substrate-binding protein
VRCSLGDQVPAALEQINAERLEALLVTAGLPFKPSSTIMEFAVEKGLPTITDVGLKIAEPSPLLSYAAVYEELARTAVLSVIKILKGANPGDLPIQLPTRLELTVNLRTAKAMGLSIPQELLWRADRVRQPAPVRTYAAACAHARYWH